MKKFLFIILYFVFGANICQADFAVYSDLKQEKTVNRGEKVEGVILISNKEDKTEQLKISQTDYRYYADGRVEFKDAGTLPRSNAGWITVKPALLTLPPKSSVSVNYTMSVPNSTELTGTYWSLIIVERAKKIEPSKLNGDIKKVDVSIHQAVRYAVLIIAHIGSTGTSLIKFTDKKSVSNYKEKKLELTLENAGDRYSRPAVWIELYNAAGTSVGRFESKKVNILPGCSIMHTFDLTKVPMGKYKVLVVADDGGDNVFGARYDLALD